MFEVVGELEGTLAHSIGELTSFGRFIFGPFSKMKLPIEFLDVFNLDKVDKSITQVTLILHRIKDYILINGQIEKVKFFNASWATQRKLFKQHVLGVFVWDVFYHYCCPAIKLNFLFTN